MTTMELAFLNAIEKMATKAIYVIQDVYGYRAWAINQVTVGEETHVFAGYTCLADTPEEAAEDAACSALFAYLGEAEYVLCFDGWHKR